MRKIVTTVAVGSALVSAGPATAATSSEVLALAATVAISSGGPSEAGRVAVGRDPTGAAVRTLLQFEALGLDAGDLEEATLVVTEPACGAGEVTAFRTTSAWDGLVTWWSEPDVDAAAPAPGHREGPCGDAPVTFDVTEQLQTALGEGEQALGLELRGDEAAGVVREFEGEAGTPPYLVLAFAESTPPPPDPDPAPGADEAAETFPAVAAVQLGDPEIVTADGPLLVGRSSAGARRRVLLDFDLPALDVDELWSATLVLRERGCAETGAAVTAYRIASAWSPGPVPWTAQPALGTSIGTIAPGACDGWATLDLTDAVRRWSTGTWGSFGIALLGDESGLGTERAFAGAGEEDGPTLVVNGPPLFAGAGSPPAPAPNPPGSAPVLVRGVVVEAGGAPVPGASVDVFPYGEPSAAQLPRLAHAVTDAQGVFVVRVPLSAPGAADAASQNGGWVDFELLVAAGTRTYPRVFSRGLGSQDWLADDGGSANEDPLRIQLDSNAAIAAGVAGVRTFGVSTALSASGCPGYQVTLLGTVIEPTKIGQMQIYNDEAMSFAYGESAHSSIDVMLSRNSGPFAIYGVVHRGTGDSNSVGTSRDFRGEKANFGKWFRTKFEYRKIRTRFDCQNTHWVEDSISARRWIGGFDLIGDLTHLNGRCGNDFKRYRQGYGKGWIAHQGEYMKRYGLGASVFGVGVGAQSYGKRWTAWRYTFGGKYDKHWLCGDTDFPLFAKTVYAGL